MRVLIINEVCGHTSTGKICAELAEKLESEGNEVKIAYGRDNYVPEKYKKYAVRIGTELDVLGHVLLSRVLDSHGLGSKRATISFIKWVEEYNPEMVWLHNLHGYYINIEQLFNWLKKHPEVEKSWTLHDCWAMTGHCAHFQYVRCDKWKSGCDNCPQKKQYPKSYFLDRSSRNYLLKKKIFSGVENLKIITPSLWLKKVVSQSYLSEYSTFVENNTINTEVFKPTQGSFKRDYGVNCNKMILGVANVWNDRKGLRDFIKLSELLGEGYSVVLVGLSEHQIKTIPNTIIGIPKTRNAEELAEIYTAADVFVNLTYEDTYPTVNLEAQACGTPCITYDSGGSPESVPEKNVIPCGDINAVCMKIKEGIFYVESRKQDCEQSDN